MRISDWSSDVCSSDLNPTMTSDANNQTTESKTETMTPTQPPKVVGTEGRLHPIAQRALQASPRDRMAMVISDCTIHSPVMDKILAEAEWVDYEPHQTREREHGSAACRERVSKTESNQVVGGVLKKKKKR